MPSRCLKAAANAPSRGVEGTRGHRVVAWNGGYEAYSLCSRAFPRLHHYLHEHRSYPPPVATQTRLHHFLCIPTHVFWRDSNAIPSLPACWLPLRAQAPPPCVVPEICLRVEMSAPQAAAPVPAVGRGVLPSATRPAASGLSAVGPPASRPSADDLLLFRLLGIGPPVIMQLVAWSFLAPLLHTPLTLLCRRRNPASRCRRPPPCPQHWLPVQTAGSGLR
jgi:hypothetical protein